MAKFRCVKCGHDRYTTAQMRATGGLLSKFFDVQSRKFTTVSCKQCHYTELYNADSSMLGNIFDFFTN